MQLMILTTTRGQKQQKEGLLICIGRNEGLGIIEIIQTLIFLAPEIAPLSLSKKSSILWFIFLKV